MRPYAVEPALSVPLGEVLVLLSEEPGDSLTCGVRGVGAVFGDSAQVSFLVVLCKNHLWCQGLNPGTRQVSSLPY